MQTASAPGKAILSGEYSVLFGAPALAIAVEQRLTVSYTPDTLPRLSWLAPDRVHELALEKFSALRHKLDNAFESYLRGERSITEILSRPAELVFYTVDMARLLGQIKTIPRGKVAIESSIPIGAGMGSSAALLAALLSMFANYKTQSELIEQVRHCERLQHGRGSLIDAAAVCMGGLVRVNGDNAERLDSLAQTFDDSFYWIYTGTPITGTGVCVEQVERRFGHSEIWTEFSAVTQELEKTLSSGQDFSHLLQQNQRLLNRIGVVPAQVAALIEQIEQLGGVAKISGAGAVAGDAGGLVIAQMHGASPKQLSLPAHYRWGPLQLSEQGACVDD